MEQARLHLGLSDLEMPTSEGGCLTVHVGDALSPSAAVDGGFAGRPLTVSALRESHDWLVS